MVRFNIECTLSFSQEQFWRIRDSSSFVQFVVDDRLLKALTISDPTSPSEKDHNDDVHDEDDGYHRHARRHEQGWLTREQKYSPYFVDCPDFIRPVVGDTMFNVSDVQYWNERIRPFHISFNITPTFLTDLSSTRGDLTVEQFPESKQRKIRHKHLVHYENENHLLHQLSHQRKFKSQRWHDLYDLSTSSISSIDSEQEEANDDDSDNSESKINSKENSRDDVVSEIDSADETTTDGDESDEAVENAKLEQKESTNNKKSKPTKQQQQQKSPKNTEEKTQAELDKEEADFVNECIDCLPSAEKSIHRIAGHTRVRILTLGWFVERAVVHNLRLFYKHYGQTVYRFRCKLYREYAGGDLSVPLSVVVDRLLEHERAMKEENEQVEKISNRDEDETQDAVHNNVEGENDSNESSNRRKDQLSCKKQLGVDPPCIAT